MKFTMNRSFLQNKLATILTAIDSKVINPIFSGVKIIAKATSLFLTASNGNISIELEIPSADKDAELIIQEEGGLVLPARFFNSIVNKLPQQEVVVEQMSNQQVAISSGSALFHLNSHSANDYPQLPKVSQESILEIPVHLLEELISETTFAASKQETRPILTGVHFVLKDGIFKAVATDSHRLSQRILPMDTKDTEFDIVLPAKSLTELSKTFRNKDEFITISMTDNQALFKTERISFYTRLLEGNYPDTDRLIPKEFITSAVFDSHYLNAAIARASLLAEKATSNIVKMQITAQRIVLSSQSPEIGYVEEELECREVTGEDLTISFNPMYVQQALQAFKGEEVKIQFISPVRPFTITPLNEKPLIELITPVRTN